MAVSKSTKSMRIKLKDLLAAEIHAAYAYTIFAEEMRRRGIRQLAEVFTKEAAEELEHTAVMAKLLRLYELTPPSIGMPAIDHLGTKEILTQSKVMEENALNLASDLYQVSLLVPKEYEVFTAMSKMIVESTAHLEWINAEIKLFDLLGEKSYLEARL